MSRIMGAFENARAHVLGWGESLPAVLEPPLRCGTCGAGPGELHVIVELGRHETLRIAERYGTVRVSA